MAINPGDRAMGGYGSGNIGGGSSVSSAGGGIRDGGMRSNGAGQMGSGGGNRVGGNGGNGGGGIRDGGMRANGGGQMASPQRGFLGGAQQNYGPAPSYPSLANAVMGNTMGSPYNNVIQYGMPTTGRVQDLPGALRNPLLPSSPMRYHAGVDIKTALGTPAVSMVPGKIAQIGNASGYGSFADVMNYDGTMTRYATHAGIDPSLSVGDIVGKGQNIGTTGAMKPGGFSHLHMEQMTPSDRAFQQIASAYNSGATATPGGFYGKTSSYNPNDIQTSTAGLLDRLGLSTGSRIAAGSAPAAPTQIAGTIPTPRPAPRPAQAAAGPVNLLTENYDNPYDIFSDPTRFPVNVSPASSTSMPPTGFGPFNPASGYVPKMEGVPIDMQLPPTGFGPFNPQSGYVPKMEGVPIDMQQPGFGSVPLPRPRPDVPMQQPGFGATPVPRPRPNFNADGQAVYGLMETIQGLLSGNPVPPNPGMINPTRERGSGREKTRYKNNFRAATDEELKKKYGLIPGQNSLI